jgi:HEAT repeat protein
MVLLVALLVGGAFLYGRFQQAGEEGLTDQVEDLSDDDIRTGLLSSNLKQRIDAFEQIGKLAEGEQKRALLDALDAPYAPTRLMAVAALGKSFPTDEAVVAAVIGLAKDDPDMDVRSAAFEALLGSGDAQVLGLAVEVLNSTDAGLAAKLSAVETLDALTGRTTAGMLSDPLESAEGAADDLGMDWDDWLEENGAKLKWNAEAKKFE